MARFTHSILAADQLVTADGDQVFDLPVNPLSVILLHVSPLNDTGTITDYSLLAGLLSAVDNVRVDHKGAAVVNARGDDLAVLAMLWHRLSIWQSNAVETNNDRRSIVLPILFGRRAYTPDEAFPATRKGEFRMTVTWDIADTGFDGLRISVETIELPDAAPSFVQRVTTLAQTFAATGQNDIDLPIGQIIRAVLLFGTTGFAGAAPAPSLAELSLLVNNLQTHYSASEFAVLRGVHGLLGIPFPPDFRHIHSVNAAGVGQENTQEPEIGGSIDDNYVLMNFDPTQDDEYSLVTEGAGRVNIRVNADTADAVRALPIEKIPAAQFTT